MQIRRNNQSRRVIDTRAVFKTVLGHVHVNHRGLDRTADLRIATEAFHT